MKHRIALHRLAILLLALALLPIAASHGQATLNILTLPDSDGPVSVDIDIYEVEIYGIDEREETFEVGARIWAEWTDPRVAFDWETVGTGFLEYKGDAVAEAFKTSIWSPNFRVVDARGAREILNANLLIFDNGKVQYDEWFRVNIKQPFHLARFPFDEHEISFTVATFSHRADEVALEPAGDERQVLDWQPQEWTVEDYDFAVYDGWENLCSESYAACSDDSQCGVGETCEPWADFDTATVSIPISRLSSHYVGNYVLPLVLLLLISSSVFWMNRKEIHLADRLSVSFTSMLTVVAFDFVTSEKLPSLGYSTVLDMILTASYVFLAIGILENVVSQRLLATRPEASRRLDRIFRVAFPLSYLACVGALMKFGNG